MNKYVVACLSIIAVTALICFFIYTQNNRFVMVNAGGGQVYKINKRTGESIMILGRKEIPVEPSEPTKKKTAEERTIGLAKAAYTLSDRYHIDNDSEIRSAVQKMMGNLKIIGWQARQVDEQTFVVTYSFDNGNGVRCWAFEVKPKEEFVRNIIGDAWLEKKYGYSLPQKQPWDIWPDVTVQQSNATNSLPPLPPGFVLDQPAKPAPVSKSKAAGYIKDQQGNIISQIGGQPAP